MNKFFGVLLFVCAVYAAPSADPEADPALLHAGHFGAPFTGLHNAAPAVAAVHAAPALAAFHAAPIAVAPHNCKVETEILLTQTCTPTAENVCSTETVETEEIEYEKVCKNVVSVLCDAPSYHGVYKREAEADAEADPQYGFAYGHGFAAAPHAVAHAAPLIHAAPIAHVAHIAHAVAHSAIATVKHACREVTTEHCVDNPKVKIVPVEVEHCHTITKVSCADVENALPKTTCEAVETTHSYALPHAVYVSHHGW